MPVIAAVSSNNHGAAVINGSGLTFTYRFPSRDATIRARKNLHRRKAIAPSSSGEGDLWLVLAVKYGGEGSSCRSACPEWAGWGGLGEGDTLRPLHITLLGMSPGTRAPARLVIPVCKGRVLA